MLGRYIFIQVIHAGVVPEFVAALQSCHTATQQAVAWGVLHMAVHGSAIANQLADGGILSALLLLYTSSPEASDRHAAAKAALKEVMAQCTHATPLLALIGVDVPKEIVVHTLRHDFRILQASVSGRREFVTSGALMTVQQLDGGFDEHGQDCVQAINSLFPTDVVKYYRQCIAR
jgi:hypothetical protein